MAVYRLTTSAWLALEVERARGVLLVNMEKDREYAVWEVLTILSKFGLYYSLQEYQAIGQQLVIQGVIEAVP